MAYLVSVPGFLTPIPTDFRLEGTGREGGDSSEATALRLVTLLPRHLHWILPQIHPRIAPRRALRHRPQAR